MPRIRHRVTDKGIIAFDTTAASGATNKGLGPKLPAGTTLSANTTLRADQAGSYVVSSSAAITITLPESSAVQGSTWVFRAGSDHAHVLLSGSAETTVRPFTDGTDTGGSLAVAALQNSSVALIGDGANFLVLGTSGSITLA